MAAVIIKWLWLIMALWALSWIPIAYFVDQTFEPGQMMEKFRTTKVIPLVVDLFIIADILWLPVLVRLMVNENGWQWTKSEMLVWGAIGLVAALVFQFVLVTSGKWPAVCGWRGGTTWVGLLHIPYFAAAVAITGPYCSHLGWQLWPIQVQNLSDSSVLWVGLGFLIQFVLDLHVPMKYVQRWLQLVWYPDVFVSDPNQFWLLIGAFTLTTLGVLVTAGLLHFFIVFMVAALYVVAIMWL